MVLYMEAENSRLKTISFPYGAFMVKRSKIGECSARSALVF